MRRGDEKIGGFSAIFAVVLTTVGTAFVYRGFALSRDEIMANFDASIFMKGMLVAAVPLEWRPFVPALEPTFRLPVPGNVAWVSSYLPINAALRALFDLVTHSGLTNPALLGVAVIAVFRIGRRLWPHRPEASVVAAVLMVTSTQGLIMAMTPYAMTGHLALNLVWLWLYLRDDRWGHTGAILVGLLACGLHQVVFHPLFVGPFILQLWVNRRWRLAGSYTGSYAIIGVIWIGYRQLVLTVAGSDTPSSGSAGEVYFLSVALNLLLSFSWDSFDLMAKNLIRFIAWQNPILIPLAVIAATLGWRSRGLMRPLVAGIGLTVLAMFVLMPYQGHGWGYRYLHGLIGSCCLIATQGWVSLTEHSSQKELHATWVAFAWGGVVSIVVLFPCRAYEVNRFLTPYASAVAAINKSTSDVVVVDTSDLAFGNDLVRNDPFLRNKPKVLVLQALDETLLRSLCSRFSVELFSREDGTALKIPHGDSENAQATALIPLMKALSCDKAQ
jgi:hypothetical protein